MTAIVSLLFFVSGVAALLFQTLWFRQAGLAFGTSVWAASLVLASFMGGLALGNASMARFGARIRRPLRAYAGIELVIGALGFGLVLLLPRLGPLLAPALRPFLETPALLNALRASISFLPLLVGLLGATPRDFGPRLAALYGWNTLGAVTGALLGEGLLIGRLGVHGTAQVAASLNASCAAAAWLLAITSRAKIPRAAPTADTTGGRAEALSSRELALLAASFLAGGVMLALEVVWFRFLSLFVHGTSLGFAILLAVVSAGIGLGGLVAALLLRRGENTPRLAPLVALLAGTLCIRGYAAFDVTPFEGRLLTSSYSITRIAVQLMFPVAFLSGLLFPLLGTQLERAVGAATRATSLLSFANTLGSMLGPLVAGFVLLPAIGMERAFFGLAAAYAVVAGLALLGPREARPPAECAALAGVALLLAYCLVTFPFGAMSSRFLQAPVARFSQLGDTRIAAAREGATETILYLRTDRFGEPYVYRMMTNGISMSGTNAAAQRYMKAFVYLPIALRPQSKHALLISYGVGMTAKALTDTRGLESIDVVDVSRDALEMSAIVHPDASVHPLNDPRVRVHVEDGRYFLQTTDRRFDLVTGEPPPPKNAGIANLYSREYFALMRARLVPGGLASYWLPVHSLEPSDARAILRAFCDVFEDCSLWNGAGFDWIVLGSNGGVEPAAEEAFTAQWRDPAVAPTLRAVGLETPEMLGALFLADGDALARLVADAPPVVDDFPERISHRAPVVSETRPEFWSWMDVERARAAFASSAFVARAWPPALRERSLPAFDPQRLVNQWSLWDALGNANTTGDLHALLTRASVVTLPLWLLLSDAQEQEIARRRFAHGDVTPDLEYVLGVGDLSERRYGAAAERFGRAARSDARPDAAFLQVYALCLAGRDTEARSAADALAARPGAGAAAAEFWGWMERLCGLRPFASAAPPPTPSEPRG
jgi:predicted membrane-bound spermidine synthase